MIGGSDERRAAFRDDTVRGELERRGYGDDGVIAEAARAVYDAAYARGVMDGQDEMARTPADTETAASPQPDADPSRDVTTVQAMIERARRPSADGSTRYRHWWADGAEAAVKLLAGRIKGLADRSADEARKAVVSGDSEVMMMATGRAIGLYAALAVVEGEA